MLSVTSIFPDLPPIFLAALLDDLTGGAFRWRSIKNLRSRKLIPEDCFVRASPRKIFIHRDNFFQWADSYATKASRALA